MLAALILVVVLGLAAVNGANDVANGVATLSGSGVTSLRRAVWWGAVCTVAGGLAAVFAAQGLVAVFSGDGLLLGAAGNDLLLAIAVGAAGWTLLATVGGLPVSTTHALVGGIVGAGLAAYGVAGVSWGGVALKAALPLAVSPVAAVLLVLVAVPLTRRTLGRLRRYCVCVERSAPVVALAGSVGALGREERLQVMAGADCPPSVLARVNAMDSLHWLSAGGTSFARALNDTPKILALGVLAAPAAGMGSAELFVLVAVAMGVGSLIGGRRVTRTLADRVTRLAPDDGFAANAVTTALVGLASLAALPVSTTHVSSSAITGVGLRKRRVAWRTVGRIGLAWVVTLPVAGALAAGAYVVVNG